MVTKQEIYDIKSKAEMWSLGIGTRKSIMLSILFRQLDEMLEDSQIQQKANGGRK